MSSTQDYINSLKRDRDTLAANINSKGVPATSAETFTSLASKVLNISGGTTPTEPSNIYKVTSVEEMNALQDVPDKAICVVDNSSVGNATADSQFQIATLPQQVVFSEPFTEFADVRYRAVDESVMLDIMGNLDSNMFTMHGFGDIGGQPVEIRIEYMSEDGGTTYNRMSPEEDTIDFRTLVYYDDMPEMWNDAIGKFLLIEKPDFNGIYRFSNNSWKYMNIGINTLPKDYLLGVKAYNNDGIIEGKLISEEITSTSEDTKKAYLVVNDLVNNVYLLKTSLHNTKDFSNLFRNYSGEYLNIIKVLDTSGIENFSSIFGECAKLKELNLSNFDTSSVTNMESMFNGCSSLTSLDLSSFDTSRVTNVAGIFGGCSSLTSLDLSNFDTSSATNMESMFFRCSSLTSLDLSSFNTSNVLRMFQMFNGCSSLTSLDLSNFDTSNVYIMGNMFYGCSSLTSLDLSNFNTSKVVNMELMFQSCRNLLNINVSSFNTSLVSDMYSMFNGCSSLTSLDLSNFDTSNVTTMERMFYGCSSLTYLDISNFTFTNVRLYSRMFYNVPNNCEILVKSETEKQWITSKWANLTNVKVKETA